MKLPKLNERGQAEAVNVQLTLIIALLVAVIVVYQLVISGVGPTTNEFICGTGGSLLNPTFSENTGASPDNWDNAVENAAVNAYDSSLEYVTTSVTDNGDPDGDGTSTTENGFWYQSVTISTVGEGVCTATVTASYRLIDNENLEAINSYIYLDNGGTENTIVWTDNSVENAATWTTISVDVLDNVEGAGTFTLYLYTEILADNDNVGSAIQVGWTAANLVITTDTTENPDYDENAADAYNNVIILAWAGIALMAVAIIILAASVILGVVNSFGGRGGV